MKKITCKNCGAVFSDTLEKCPYCGTMNKKGAYIGFRKKVSALVDSMLGLKKEVHDSVSRSIFLSLLRSLLLIAFVVLAAFVVSRFSNVNYYNDKEYDLEAYENILWEDQNLEKLDEAYRKQDYDTVQKLYYENSNVVSKWPHYQTYTLKKKYRDIVSRDRFTYSEMGDVLYFLFYPEYITGYNGMKRVDSEEYDLMREALITLMNQKGFSEAKLEEIYEKHCDQYGYLNFSDLKEYLKEENNG